MVTGMFTRHESCFCVSQNVLQQYLTEGRQISGDFFTERFNKAKHYGYVCIPATGFLDWAVWQSEPVIAPRLNNVEVVCM